MKLSQETISILKNFSTLNQSIQFKEGDVIKTRTDANDVFATAQINETFPQDFAIYELNRFLNVISLFNDPDLVFEESAVTITDGTNEVRYVFADPSLITAANYEKNIKMPATLCEFDLKQGDFAKLQKAAAVLGVPTITVSGKNGVISISAHDKKNSSSDRFSISIPADADTTDFTVDFKLDNLRFLAGDYRVTISEKIICRFQNTSLNNVTYHVAGLVQA